MITPELIIAFPALFEPKESLSGDMKYGGCFLIDETNKDGIKALQQEVDRAIEYGIKKKWNNKRPKFKNEPLRSGNKYLEEYSINNGEEPPANFIKIYENRVFFNAACTLKEPPGIVGPTNHPLTDESAIYTGAIVLADVRAFPYSFSGNNGVTWWLNNVMLVRDGERIDGKLDAVDAFAAYAQKPEDLMKESASQTETGDLA